MNNKLPTAQELSSGCIDGKENQIETQRLMIAFAKLHVEVALEKALEEAYCDMYTEIVRESVLESYPLSNIK